MTKRRLLSVFLTVLIAISAFVTALPATTANAATSWQLYWSDEFNGANGSAVDGSKWSFDTGRGPNNDGWGNNELQYYTNRTANAYQENGSLVIKAMKENYGGAAYTSARLRTNGKFDFTYGKVEMRAKLPYGRGIWPAFWMLGSDIMANPSNPWPNCGEIDIMENVGDLAPGRVYGTLHGPGYSGGSAISASYLGSGLSDGFHTYTIEWEQNVIRFYFDGILYSTRTPADLGGKTWVFNKNFFMLLNLAVGGAWPGYPDASTVFPQYYLIDYIRVSKPVYSSNIIALKSVYNGKYVCADNAGASPLIANKAAIGTWEKFERIDNGNGTFGLKSLANGKFVCADNGGANPLIANRDSIGGAWESFQFVTTASGKTGIKAMANNKFVCADNYGNNPLIANRDAVGGNWEEFEVIPQ